MHQGDRNANRRKAPCMCCGKVVAVRHRTQNTSVYAGKGRVRHKCPHGEWCIAGQFTHGFNWPKCKTCMAERKVQYQTDHSIYGTQQ